MDTYSSHPKTNQGINDKKKKKNSQANKPHSSDDQLTNKIAHDNTVAHYQNHSRKITL